MSQETLFSVLTTRSDTNRAIKATEGGHWLEAYLDLGGGEFLLLVSKKRQNAMMGCAPLFLRIYKKPMFLMS